VFVRHKIFGCTWHCLNKNQVSTIFLCITSFVFCTHLLYECTAADMGGNHACIHETWSSWSINGCLHAADLLYATGSANNSTTAHLVFVKGQWLEEKEKVCCCKNMFCCQKYTVEVGKILNQKPTVIPIVHVSSRARNNWRPFASVSGAYSTIVTSSDEAFTMTRIRDTRWWEGRQRWHEKAHLQMKLSLFF